MAHVGDELGVPVALDDLGRHRLGLEPERVAHLLLDLGRHVGEGADRAGDLPDPDGLPGPDQALAVPPGLGVPAGDLEAERGRLGVNPVGPADRQRVPVRRASRPRLARRRSTPAISRSAASTSASASAVSTTSEEVRPTWTNRESAPIEPSRSVRKAMTSWRTRASIVRDAAGVDPRPLADPVERVGGNDAPARPRLAHRQLDPEPARVLGVLAPEGAHLGAGVPRDHGARPPSDPDCPRGAGTSGLLGPRATSDSGPSRRRSAEGLHVAARSPARCRRGSRRT